MTDAQIDTAQVRAQKWTIVASPSLGAVALSTFAPDSRFAAKSPRASDLYTRHTDLPLEELLFDNAAALKEAYSAVARHLAPQWREIIFNQLDDLLDPAGWEEDSALIGRASFRTFLRFVIFAGPMRLPSLGVGPAGHVLAAWISGDQRITVEFLPEDRASGAFVMQGDRSRETLTWRGHVASLRAFVERNGMIECLVDSSG